MKSAVVLFWLLALLVSCSSSQTKLMQDGHITNNNYNDTVAFNFDYNLPLITVEIDNVKYNFLLDTGAPSVISPELFEKLKLKRKLSTKIYDSNNESNSEVMTIIPSMRIGEINYENIGVLVVDLKKSFALKCLVIDGIVGANQMAKSYWKLDYDKKVCVISKNLPLSEVENFEVVKFSPKSGQLTPLVSLTIDETKYDNVIFDTGFNGTMSLPMNDKLNSFFEKKVEVTGVESAGLYGLGAVKKFYETQLPSMKMDSFQMKNQSITFSDDPSKTIGNGVFKNYTVIIDWNTNKIFLKANSNEKNRKINMFSSFGFSYIKKEDKVEIISLIENSEAEKKGMLIGDELIGINEMKFKDFDDSQFCDFLFFGLKNSELGDIAKVTVLRNNEELVFSLIKENYFK